MAYWSLAVIISHCILLKSVVVDTKHYTPDWDSIDSRPIPEWYNDAKFGIFMHFTTSVVPGNVLETVVRD